MRTWTQTGLRTWAHGVTITRGSHRSSGEGEPRDPPSALARPGARNFFTWRDPSPRTTSQSTIDRSSEVYYGPTRQSLRMVLSGVVVEGARARALSLSRLVHHLIRHTTSELGTPIQPRGSRHHRKRIFSTVAGTRLRPPPLSLSLESCRSLLSTASMEEAQGIVYCLSSR